MSKQDIGLLIYGLSVVFTIISGVVLLFTMYDDVDLAFTSLICVVFGFLAQLIGAAIFESN